MVKTILSTTHSDSEAGTTTASTTEYWLFGYSAFERSTTESTRQVIWRSPGTLSKLYVRITATTGTGTGTVTIRKNTADAALTVNVNCASGAQVIEDTSNTVTVAAADLLCIKTVTPAGATFTMSIVSCIWDATTNCSVRYVAKGYGLATASATQYLPIAGDRSGTTTSEANVENTIKTAGSLKNMAANITANARTNNTTFTARDTRADTTLLITATSGQTGQLEDTDSVSMAVDDELDFKLTTLTGTQTLTLNSLAVDYETTTNNGVLTRGCVGSTADYTYTTSASPPTWYMPIGAGSREGITTEADVQMKAREAFTFKNLIVYTNSNSIAGNTIICLRVNGVDSALTTTIGSTASGFFADTNAAHNVTVAAGDLINFKISTSAIAGSLSLRQLGITTELAPSGQNITRALATETTTISEVSLTEQTAKTRPIAAQTVSISENRTRLAAKQRPLATQTTTITEVSLTRVKGKVKTLATETITVTGGTLANLRNKIRTASDTVTKGESATRLKAAMRPIATQTVTVGDGTLVRLKGAVKALAPQTIAFGESVARITAKQRAAQDTVSISGIASRVKAANRAISQAISIGESVARVKAATRSLALQSVTISSGSITRLTAKIRTLSQSVASAESVVIEKVGEVVRVIVQTVSVSEALTRLTVKSRALTTATETTAISETLAKVKGKFRVLATQSVAISENIARIKAATRAIPIQTTLASETLSRLTARIRTLSQSVAVSDSLNREINQIIKHIVRTITDTVPILEQLLNVTDKWRSRYRRIKDPSNKKLRSNHPSYLLGTRGQHDDYIEF